jgi:hypothetical protein
MIERAEDLQTEALCAFTLLTMLQPEWGGALIVARVLGSGGQALSIAANIAGAGCLAIDARAEVCRAASRSGACDFIVNTVDEALRILKNELRQRKPVSIALQSREVAALEELLDRGVLPQVFTAFHGDEDSSAFARRFAGIGSQIVDFDGTLTATDSAIDAAQRLEDFTREHGRRLESVTFASSEELQVFDTRLLEILQAPDARRTWCAAAPRFFHRERPFRRVVYLTAEELERLR